MPIDRTLRASTISALLALCLSASVAAAQEPAKKPAPPIKATKAAPKLARGAAVKGKAAAGRGAVKGGKKKTGRR